MHIRRIHKSSGGGGHSEAERLDNRISSDDTWNYTYDAEGNTLTKTNISTNEQWTYSYDSAHQLTSAVDKNSGGTVLQQVTYQYDVFGNRVEADVTVSGTTTVTKYAYNGSDVWADLNNSSQLTMRRLYDATDAVFARIDSSGNAAWYLTDHLGSVRDIESNSTQAILDHLDYDAYGKITNETNSANGDRFKYAAGWFENTTALYHFGARDYDPATGRWREEDPIRFGGGDANLDRYVGNGPTDGTDPSGLAAKELVRETMSDGRIKLFQVDKPGLLRNFFRAYRNSVTGTTLYVGFIDPAVDDTTVFREDVEGSVDLSLVERDIGDVSDWKSWFKGLVDKASFRDKDSAVSVERDYLRKLTPQSRAEDELIIGDAIPKGRGAGYQKLANEAVKEAKGIVAQYAVAGFTVSYSWNRSGHIFRSARGHVAPVSQQGKNYYVGLFRKVASNPTNLRTDAVAAGLITAQAERQGVKAYTQTLKNGKQVWVTVKNAEIQNAGVNLAGEHR